MTADLESRVHQHAAYFEHLRTFQQVQHWDTAAAALASELEAAIASLRQQATQHVAHADQLRDERARLPFFKRLFASRAPERQFRGYASSLLQSAHQLGMLMNDLLERIDYTPNDETEQKLLLKELRAERKDLQLEKRELAAEKRAINRAAREASANAGHGIFFYDSKVAASERRAIRRQRAADLAPVENHAAYIEQQMRDLDRRLVWVELFTSDAHDIRNLTAGRSRTRAARR